MRKSCQLLLYKFFAVIPLPNTNLCFLQQVRYRNTAVWHESLQLKGGDDQGQRGALWRATAAGGLPHTSGCYVEGRDPLRPQLLHIGPVQDQRACNVDRKSSSVLMRRSLCSLSETAAPALSSSFRDRQSRSALCKSFYAWNQLLSSLTFMASLKEVIETMENACLSLLKLRGG